MRVDVPIVFSIVGTEGVKNGFDCLSWTWSFSFVYLGGGFGLEEEEKGIRGGKGGGLYMLCVYVGGLCHSHTPSNVLSAGEEGGSKICIVSATS